MASGVLYLDIDDEITSAASRIRDAEDVRVAVVVPYGSRVATSRINFRLLARDATTHRKRLSIVATDPATRALAASAGLPVFSSVGEYESSLGETGDDGGSAHPSVGAPMAPLATALAPSQPVEGSETARVATGLPRARGGARSRSAPPPGQATLDEMAVPRGQDPAVQGRPATRPERTIERAGPGRTPLLVALALLALVVLVGGIGAYLFLPSASAVITPRREAVGPIDITIVADPTVTTPDPARGIVPATSISIDAVASQTFTATGKRVEQQPATGVVRFRNKDFTSSNTIPKGSLVSTAAGIRFRTDQTVTVGRANIVGLQIFPRTATVSVTAVKPGTEGNVPANSIVVIPRGEDPIALDVTNPDDTTGGTRDEFPKIVQADVDGALATLQTALEADFHAKLADPANAPVGATVFAETGVLETGTPSVDPTTLVGQEIATFDLGLTATGTATAVDEAPVRSVAEQQLRTKIDSAHQLVDGSVQVTVQPAVVAGGRVTFPAQARATQIALLDADAIKEQLKGRSLDDARSILATYGTVDLTVWPDWVSSVPTMDSRIDLTIATAVSVQTPTVGPSATP